MLVLTGRSSGNITTAPRLVSEYLIKNENKHQIMNLHTNCNCLIPILSSLVMCYLFQLALKMLVLTGRSSGKITTAPRLVSEHLIKKENKHQITNVQTKWNYLIPILSSLVMYYSFQS